MSDPCIKASEAADRIGVSLNTGRLWSMSFMNDKDKKIFLLALVDFDYVLIFSGIISVFYFAFPWLGQDWHKCHYKGFPIILALQVPVILYSILVFLSKKLAVKNKRE